MAAVWTMACSKGRFNTSKAIFRRIARSFEALMDCQTTGGFFPVVIWTTGDLEYFSDFHHVARWNASRPCCLCSVPKEALQHVPPFETLALQADDWSLPRSHPCPLFQCTPNISVVTCVCLKPWCGWWSLSSQAQKVWSIDCKHSCMKQRCLGCKQETGYSNAGFCFYVSLRFFVLGFLVCNAKSQRLE